MRVVLTGLLGRRRRTNSPMKSRLAATSLGHKQPKTHLEVGTKNPVRSQVNSLSFHLVQKRPVTSRVGGRSATVDCQETAIPESNLPSI